MEQSTDERMMFHYVIKDTERLMDCAGLFNPKGSYHTVADQMRKFLQTYGSIPKPQQLIQADMCGTATPDVIERMFGYDPTAACDPKWLEETWKDWRDTTQFVNYVFKLTTLVQTNGGPDKVQGSKIWKEAQALTDKVIAARSKTAKRQFAFSMMTGQEIMDEAAKLPDCVELFGEMIVEGETTFLYGSPNSAKSTLAVALCDVWSRGTSLMGKTNTGGPRKVVYVDFEMSLKQFEKRAKDDLGSHLFDPNFVRLTLNPDVDFRSAGFATMELFMEASLEQVIQTQAPKILVIDNLSYLVSGEAEKSSVAGALMKKMRALRDKYGLTLIIVTHMPKPSSDKGLIRGLQLSQINGSSTFGNQIDAAIAMSKLDGADNIRYLKHVKVRNSEVVHGDENVLAFSLNKVDHLLTPVMIECLPEMDLLNKGGVEKIKSRTEQQAIDLHRQGKTYTDIEKVTGISRGSLGRLFKKSEDATSLTKKNQSVFEL